METDIFSYFLNLQKRRRFLFLQNAGNCKLPESGRGLTSNCLLKQNHQNDCYIYDFYFYYCGTVLNCLKVFQKKLSCENWNVFFLKLHETDTSLYFLTVEKVVVSLSIKCLRNATNS